MQRLYFVRHGQSQANVDRVFAGQVDTPLTTLGRTEANEAVKQIKPLGIDYIISSPLSRTRDTALIIAEGIGFPAENIEFNALFMERNLGAAAGLSWDNDISGLSDVETMDSVAARATEAYKYVAGLPYENILVVGHGTFWQKFYTAAHPGQTVTDADEPHNAEVSQIV